MQQKQQSGTVLLFYRHLRFGGLALEFEFAIEALQVGEHTLPVWLVAHQHHVLDIK